MNKNQKREAINRRGEVFTPMDLVKEMVDKLPQEILLNPEKSVGDVAGCGDGNFLIEVLNRRINAGVSHLNALKTIYGVDIDKTNVKKCKERLSLKSKDKEIWSVLNNNIICADALNKNHRGWWGVGYMWGGPPIENRWIDV